MTLTQIGLILNIVGTIIVCFYGLPNYYYSESGGTYLVINSSQKAIKSNKRRKTIAWLGIILLFVGFSLQFIDTLLIK